MGKRPKASKASPDVEQAISQLRQFHQMGLDSIQSNASHSGYGTSRIKTEADGLGVNEDLLRKARKFASVYKDADLVKLSALCREHGFAIGQSHVIGLLAIDAKPERERIQKLSIEGHWTKSRLRQEIGARHRPRRTGGRRPKLADDRPGLLAQIEIMCETWQRWYAELKRKPKTSKPREAHLPKSVRQQIAHSVEQLMELQRIAGRELTLERPSRLPRSVLHDEREQRST